MPNPWDRQRNDDGELEPIRWYERFEGYRLMGPARSILGCYKEHVAKTSPERPIPVWVPRPWRDNADKWYWQERSESWDMENIAKRREEQAAWAEEWKAKEKDMAQKLLDRALDMLKFPLAEVTRTGEDGKTTVVMPVDWRASDVKQYAETASKLARLAAELNTEQIGVNVNRDELVAGIEADIARLAALRAGASGGDIPGEDADARGDDNSQL